MIRAHSMSLPHLSADPQRAPLIASKKCSGRHAARLRRDGITARLSCSFNFLATRGTDGPSWLSFIGHVKDSLWSVDLFHCESILLRSHWVMVVMDVFTRRIIGFGVERAGLCGVSVC